jgi:hypothetical protein
MATDVVEPLTDKRFDGPKVTQFSVFVKNRAGALMNIVKLLQKGNIEVVALSVLDATDSAVVRMLVSDPEQVEEMFRKNDIAFSTTDMVVVEMVEVGRDLARVLTALLQAEVNIFFSYPLLTRPHGRSALALHVDDDECATAVLQGERFRLLSQIDISR